MTRPKRALRPASLDSVRHSPIEDLLAEQAGRVVFDALIQLDEQAADTTGGKRRAAQLAYLNARAMAASPSLAAAAANVSASTVQTWRRTDEAFAAEEQAAISQGADRMEDELVRRAIEGVRETIYYRGKRIGERLKYSDLLLMFALKGARPEKYADKQGDTNVTVGLTLADLRASLSTSEPAPQVVDVQARELPAGD